VLCPCVLHKITDKQILPAGASPSLVNNSTLSPSPGLDFFPVRTISAPCLMCTKRNIACSRPDGASRCTECSHHKQACVPADGPNITYGDSQGSGKAASSSAPKGKSREPSRKSKSIQYQGKKKFSGFRLISY